MPTNIKMPLRSLDEATIRDLQEKYPEAEVSLELHPDRHKGPLSEQHFWEIIAMLDWTQTEDEAITAPAVAYLAAGPLRHIYEFADVLSEKLFTLDPKAFALHIGADAWTPGRYFSVDTFLYARCCVIANGQELYEQVLQDPTKMPKDLTFEPLLSLAGRAYQKKTGEEFDYFPTTMYETFSNPEGWEETLWDRIKE